MNIKDALSTTAVGSLVNNTAEIATAKALALTPFVGFIDKVVFAVSAFWVQTFKELSQKTAARFVTHDVINGKPVTEFTGVNLQTFDFEITLHSAFGVEPLTFYDTLKEMCESGGNYYMFIEGRNYGKFNILSVERDTKMWSQGRPAVMDIHLQLQEYVESLPTEAETKLRQDELKRGDTGKGGPERIPGSGAPLQEVELTPAPSGGSNFTGFR